MKESPREVKISLVSAAILLHNVFIATRDGRIGYVDADRTLDQLLKGLNKDVYFKTEELESALYYSNMLDEDQNFWHPMGTNFKTFLSRVLPNEIGFDEYYNNLYIKDEYE